MRYHHFEMLPEDAFQHCGNRKIQLHGGGNPFSFIGDAISSIGNAFEDVIGTVGDGLAGLDDWVREEIPGGWLLPVAVVATIYGGPAAGEAIMEGGAAVEGGAAAAGATTGAVASGTMTAAQINAMLAAEQAASVVGGVTAGTAAATTGAAGALTASQVAAANLAAGAASGAYGATVASLVAAGMPASMAMALPSVSTLASNAAVNAAMQMATTGKVNVDSLVKSLAMGSVSSVVGAGVSSAVGSAGIEDKLLQSIANSAAQGATGAVLSGRNPVTAALASALAGGVGYATQGSGLPQTAINTTINALASGQSVQNALISAAIATGSSAAKDQIKGFFQDIGAAQGKTKEEVGTAFENMVAAKTEENNFTASKREEFTKDQATIDGNKERTEAFQGLRDEYDAKIASYEKNKDIARTPGAYEAEMRSQGYEFVKGYEDSDDRWIKRTGGQWKDVDDGEGGTRRAYVPDRQDDDGNSAREIGAPSQDSFIALANADVREANAIGEQLNTAYTGDKIDIGALQSTIDEQGKIYQTKSAAAEKPDDALTRMGYTYVQTAEGGWNYDADEAYGPSYGWVNANGEGPPESLTTDLQSKYDTNTAEANAAKATLDDANAKLSTAAKTNDIIDKYGVKDVFAANKRINDNLALYKDLSTATTTALTTLNGFVPPEKIADFINTETATQAEEKTTDEATKAKIAADAEKERVRLQAETDAKNKETTEVIPEVTPEVTPEVKPEPKPSDNFIDPSKDDFRMPVTDEEKKAYQDFADQTDPTKVEIIGGGDTTETPITPAPDQGEVPPPPPVEPPPVETKPTEPNPPVVEPKHDPATDPNYCGPGWHWDGTKCVIDGEEPKPDIPDCGPGMVWSLTDNACVPVADVTKPVVTPITPKPPVTPPVVPVKPVVPTVDPAIAAAQTQQNQQNSLLMGLLLGQQQQAPAAPQGDIGAKITPYDFEKDILGGADYLKETRQPYAAGGSVRAINEELLKMLRS